MARSQRARALVHLISMTNPLGDIVIVVPPGEAWISKAIEKLPEYGRHWSEPLLSWLMAPSMDDMMTDAIEAAAGHDEPWCDECIAWIEGKSRTKCPVWDSMAKIIEASGFEIVDLDAQESAVREEVRASKRKQREAMGPTFRIPDSIKKLFSDPSNPAHQFLKEQAREGVKQVVKAMGVKVPDEVVENLFEAFYVSAFEEMRPRGDSRMTAAQAAEILGCKWPCDQAAVTAAFRIKAKETHPDAHPNATEAEREKFKAAFIRVGLARETLMAEFA